MTAGSATRSAPATGHVPRTIFALLLVASSIGQVLKFLGPFGVVAYVVVTFSLTYFALPRIARAAHVLSKRGVAILFTLAMALLTIAFAVGYPIANSGRFGRGSDRDDNLNLATTELLHGQDPYAVHGYLGAPVDVLGGAIVVAVPFVLLGNSAYQNLLWLAVFFFATRAHFRDGRQALVALCALVALAPAVLQELATGGDLIANSIYPIVFALLFVAAAGNPSAAVWKKIVASLAFGTGIASRGNFALIVPMVWSLLALKTTWREATKWMALAGVALAALTVPFYLVDPNGYPPLRLQNRFDDFDEVLPNAALLVPAATIALVLALSARRILRNEAGLLRACTIVLGFPVLTGLALNVALNGTRGLMFAVQGWGLFFLFSGVLWMWSAAFGTWLSSPAAK